MHCISLLPQERRHARVVEYYTHLGVVLLVGVSALCVIGTALLVPTYLHVTQAISATETAIREAEAQAASQEEIDARTVVVETRSQKLAQDLKTKRVSVLLSEALLVSRPNVRLINFSYKAAAAEAPATLLISGIADTREMLQAYQHEVRDATFAKKVELPVSAYAKDTDIPFTLTVTLQP